MKYKVVLTEQSEFDLRSIYEYIAFTLLEPEVATKQVERIERAILKLNEKPMRFRIFEKEPWYSRGLRWFPVDNFLIFFIPEIENATVTIIRIMYGRRNIEEQLNRIKQ